MAQYVSSGDARGFVVVNDVNYIERKKLVKLACIKEKISRLHAHFSKENKSAGSVFQNVFLFCPREHT